MRHNGAMDFSASPVEAAIGRARSLLSSAAIEDRVSGWELIGELCSGHPENVPAAWPLAEASIAQEREPEVLPGALWTLGVMHIDGALPAVLARTRSAAQTVRLEAARAIPSCASHPEDERAIQALITLTADADDDVRDWATFGLGTQLDVDTPVVREALAARLEDPHDDTRAEAVVALAQRGDKRAFAPVLAELTSGCVGRLAVEAAKLLADDRLLGPLLDLRDWWDPDDPTHLLEVAIRRCDPARRAADDAAGARLGAAVQRTFPAVMPDGQLLRVHVDASALLDERNLVTEWVDVTGRHHSSRQWVDGLLHTSGGDATRAASNALTAMAARTTTG